jgi:hypothetical protein
MASMAAKGIVLPTNPMTPMTMGFEDQSSEMSSMAMATHRKLKKVNSDEAVPVSCHTCCRIRWLRDGAAHAQEQRIGIHGQREVRGRGLSQDQQGAGEKKHARQGDEKDPARFDIDEHTCAQKRSQRHGKGIEGKIEAVDLLRHAEAADANV